MIDLKQEINPSCARAMETNKHEKSFRGLSMTLHPKLKLLPETLCKKIPIVIVHFLSIVIGKFF